jgi:hypothetical protein
VKVENFQLYLGCNPNYKPPRKALLTSVLIIITLGILMAASFIVTSTVTNAFNAISSSVSQIPL